MTDVIMPQMGESIAEGTITRWIKKVGDVVQRDEPLFEISTDKVDAEIPAPSAGTLLEIRNQEGETVAAAAAASPAPPQAAKPAAAAPPAPAPASALPSPAATPQRSDAQAAPA